MKTRFAKTRRNRKFQTQSGGARLSYETTKIFDINQSIKPDNIWGVLRLKTQLENAGVHTVYTERLDIANFLTYGNLFNTSVDYHQYKGNGYLLGVSRTTVPTSDFDKRTGTNMHNRDAFSNNSPWKGGWGVPDYPLFFILKISTKEIHFFHMSHQINYLTNQNFMNLQMEDPRIKIHKDAGIILFFAHHNTDIRGNNQYFYQKMGANLAEGLNTKEKKTPLPAVLNPGEPQYPYVSYCTVEEIEGFIELFFITKNYKEDTLKRQIPNSVWKPLCSNLLNVSPEKNWTILTNTLQTREGNPYPVFDFVRSWGEFTKGMVVFRYPLERLTSPPVDKGRFNEIATKCDYIQSIEGIYKQAGLPAEKRAYEGYFDVPNNDKITIIRDKTKYWFNLLLKAFVDYIPKGQHNFKSSLLTLTKTDDRIVYTYPFYNGENKPCTKEILLEKINTLSISFTKGISTGGPVCSIIGGQPNEALGVGHLKLLHENVYIGMVAALLYKNEEAFRNYLRGNLPGDMSAGERTVFFEFVQYLTNEVNIFRYTYTVIHQLNPYNPRVELKGQEGRYNLLNILHHDQMYSSFLYKMSKDKFELRTLSPQFYVDNSPTDCHAPVLQFSSTIANNNLNSYYIPYGDLDCRGRILSIGYKDLHNFLKMEKILGEAQGKDDHAGYFGIIQEFFKIHTLKPSKEGISDILAEEHNI